MNPPSRGSGHSQRLQERHEDCWLGIDGLPGSYSAQTWPVANSSHSITFWSQVASAFDAGGEVIFDLLGEPFIGNNHPTASDWQGWLDGRTTTF
jgi:hypothetical protein